MRGIDAEHGIDPLARFVIARVVHVELGEEQVRVGEIAVDLERALRGGGGGGRILVGQRPREPGMRRRPFGLGLEDLLERPQRFRLVVLLQEQQPPRGIDRRIRRRARRGAKQRVRVTRLAEGIGRPSRAEDRLAIVRVLAEHLVEQTRRRLRPAEMLMQQPELQRRLARPVSTRSGLENRDGFVVLPARDRQLSQDRRRGRIAGRSLLRLRLGLGRTAARDRTPCDRTEALCSALTGILSGGGRGKRGPGREV